MTSESASPRTSTPSQNDWLAEQHRVAELAKARQQFVLGSVALQQKREVESVALECILQHVLRGAHRAQRSEQAERASARGADHRQARATTACV